MKFVSFLLCMAVTVHSALCLPGILKSKTDKCVKEVQNAQLMNWSIPKHCITPQVCRKLGKAAMPEECSDPGQLSVDPKQKLSMCQKQFESSNSIPAGCENVIAPEEPEKREEWCHQRQREAEEASAASKSAQGGTSKIKSILKSAKKLVSSSSSTYTPDCPPLEARNLVSWCQKQRTIAKTHPTRGLNVPFIQKGCSSVGIIKSGSRPAKVKVLTANSARF